MPRLRSRILCGHQKTMGKSPHAIDRLFVKSSALCRDARLPLDPCFARFSLSEYVA
jgi:hypothetical protein